MPGVKKSPTPKQNLELCVKAGFISRGISIPCAGRVEKDLVKSCPCLTQEENGSVSLRHTHSMCVLRADQ